MRRNFAVCIVALLIGIFLANCSSPVAPSSTATSIPKPTITAVGEDSQFCQDRMQLSAPVAVWPESTDGTNNTGGNQWPSDPRAVSTSAGILVTWQTFNNQYSKVRDYVRLLDDNAQPIGEVSSPFERSGIQRPSFASKEGGGLLAFCEDQQDTDLKVKSVLLDPYGKFISEQHHFSTRYGCAFYKADALWTGSRMLFAWYSETMSEKSINDIWFGVADASGNNLREKKLRTDGMLEPDLAYGHGRALMVVPIRTDYDFMKGLRGKTHLAVHRFDVDGNEIQEPLILEPLPGAEFGISFIAPTEDGWLIVASTSRADSRYYLVRLAPDGSLVSGPDLVNTGSDVFFVDMIPYGGGAVALLSGYLNHYSDFSKVLFFDADGSLRQEWSVGGSLGLGGLVAHKGKLFMLYAATLPGNPKTDQVFIREFQCAP